MIRVMLDTSAKLRALMAAYALHSGRRLSTVSRLASGSGATATRLSRGHDITTRRAARIVQWLSDHWPEDTRWPVDIPRPPPTVGTS